MSVVAAVLRRHGMRTLLYVDDLLIACSSFEDVSQSRRIIEETLLSAGIVRAPLKGYFDTPLQTLPDHLGFSISTIVKRSPTGSREEVLCAPPSSASAAFRGFEGSPRENRGEDFEKKV